MISGYWVLGEHDTMQSGARKRDEQGEMFQKLLLLELPTPGNTSQQTGISVKRVRCVILVLLSPPRGVESRNSGS